MHLGLIGYPLGHSWSQAWFTEKAYREGIHGLVYDLFPMKSIEELPALLKAHPDLAGLNVTIPHKQSVRPLLDHMDPRAAEIGAVNCILIRDSHTTGFNTDAPAFDNTLPESVEGPALVLGTGGAARAVTWVLRERGIPFRFVSRNPEPENLTYGDLTPEIIRQHMLIINATPLGMYPDVNTFPDLPYEAIGDNHFLYDLVYNPERTVFLARGLARGATVKNGLEMLYAQAELSWLIWTGQSF